MADETIFDEANKDTTLENGENYLDRYVGEGKKYATVEDLAKAYYNADQHIPELKSDLDSLKKFTLEQFRKQAEANPDPKPNTPNEDDKGGDNRPPESPPKDGEEKKVDISELVRQELEKADRTKTAQTNAQFTESVMLKQFGSKEAAVKAVQDKAAELEVNPQFLADLAFSSPKAFFTTMGIKPEEPPRSTNTPNSSSNVNPTMLNQNNGQPKQGTYAHYEALRKSDPKKYWHRDTQAQLMKDAMTLGDDFFKR